MATVTVHVAKPQLSRLIARALDGEDVIIARRIGGMGHKQLTSDACHYSLAWHMIGSFKDRRLKRLYEAGDRSRLAPEHVEKIENILARLEAAAILEDMNLPGFRLHPLKGDRKGFWSVTVRANWRIIFRFENGTAFDVELTDYH